MTRLLFNKRFVQVKGLYWPISRLGKVFKQDRDSGFLTVFLEVSFDVSGGIFLLFGGQMTAGQTGQSGQCSLQNTWLCTAAAPFRR